jgi:uncharacterized membrane protein
MGCKFSVFCSKKTCQECEDREDEQFYGQAEEIAKKEDATGDIFDELGYKQGS